VFRVIRGYFLMLYLQSYKDWDHETTRNITKKETKEQYPVLILAGKAASAQKK
jgi:hypothetical protein